jgi:hypothetical protein
MTPIPTTNSKLYKSQLHAYFVRVESITRYGGHRFGRN